METKEWDLREGDIIIPVDNIPPAPPRYAILVQIISVEQPWALERPLLAAQDFMEEKSDIVKSMPSEKTSQDKIKITKNIVGKATSLEKALPPNDVTTKKIKKDTNDGTYQNVVAMPMNKIDQHTMNEPQLVSKASFSFQFPGAPTPPLEIGPEIGEAIAPELPRPPCIPPSESIEGDTDLDDLEEPSIDPLDHEPPPHLTTRFINIPTKEFDLVSNYALWHKLLNEPLLVTMYWTSPSGATRLPFAQARVDLFPVLRLTEGKLEGSYKLEKIPQTPFPMEEANHSKSKRGAKGGTKEKAEEGKSLEEKGKKTKKKKVEIEAPLEETPPLLLEGAELKIALSTTHPFWSEDDILHSVIVEYDIGFVRNLPPKVVEFALKPPAIKGNSVVDPFSYTLAMELPGFFGFKWWDDIKDMTLEEKATIAQVRFEGGKVEVEEVAPIPEKKPSISPPQGSVEEALRSIRKVEEEKAIRDTMTWESIQAKNAKERLEKMEHEHLVKKLLHSDTSFVHEPIASTNQLVPKLDFELAPQAMVKWPNHPIVKRFLPGRAKHELKDLVKLGHHFRGEVARVVEPPLELHDTNFDKYHGCFFLDLTPFLEEGCWAFELEVSFQSYSLMGTRAGIPLIELPNLTCDPPPNNITKPGSPKPSSPKASRKKQQPKSTLLQLDEDPPLPICMDPKNPLPNNAWQLSKAFLSMKIKTDKPMEPFWEPPPEPEISLEDVIPPRPKQASVYDAIQMALDKFAEFVEYAGKDLLDMYQDLITKDLFQENNDEEKDVNVLQKRRFETKGEIRKKMVKQLKKKGLWDDIREEMKTKVLKVAAEKYREKKRATLDIGKFEFCNNLYVSLSELILNTLKKMLEKRKGKKTKVIDNIIRLRQYADEYEAEEDYKGASRCHQERLLGENIYDPDVWFEYGCFCMRVRPKDQGKAEECWREALTLKNNHLFSLQALGCLLWHRGYLTQAEVMFRNAINLHTPEEHINWVLVSQVYAAQGKEDNARRCLKRAESLYFSRQDSQTTYSPPHQLLSPLWRFPFSISYLALLSQNASGVYIDAAMLLLDLHLPNEAELILGLEIDIYTCTLDNKWCRARIAELNGRLEQGQNFMKEALSINKENPTSWILLGHMRYSYDPPTDYTDVLQSNLYRGAIDAFNQYQRFLRDDEEYYKFVYLELGYSFCKLGAWDEGRKLFLKGCTTSPTSPALWLAIGIAYFHVGDLSHAELALVEGNVLDISNFKIWAYLTLVCLRSERHEEAEVSFQQGLKCIVDPDLLVTIGEGFARIGNFRDAESAYLESLKVKEVASIRFQLAEMYFKEGKITFAIPCYETIVKAHDATLEHKSVSISRLTEMQKDDGPNAPTNRHLKDLPVEI